MIKIDFEINECNNQFNEVLNFVHQYFDNVDKKYSMRYYVSFGDYDEYKYNLIGISTFTGINDSNKSLYIYIDCNDDIDLSSSNTYIDDEIIKNIVSKN